MRIDLTNMSGVTFGLGVEGFRPSASLLGGQKDIGRAFPEGSMKHV